MRLKKEINFNIKQVIRNQSSNFKGSKNLKRTTLYLSNLKYSKRNAGVFFPILYTYR